jgi:hypothetical protein
MPGIRWPAIGRVHPRAYIVNEVAVTLPRKAGMAFLMVLIMLLGRRAFLRRPVDVKDAK